MMELEHDEEELLNETNYHRLVNGKNDDNQEDQKYDDKLKLEEEQSHIARGIDYGTTKTVVAEICTTQLSEPMIKVIDNKMTTPTCLLWDTEIKAWFFGHLSKNNAYKHPEFYYHEIKRLMGKKLSFIITVLFISLH